MKDHKSCIRGFHWSAKAWYRSVLTGKEINFGMYAQEGGTTGEMSMVWHNLQGKEIPRLECFDDGWNALSLFTDLIQALGQVDDENITQERFVEILLCCGFKDMTAYTRDQKGE